MAGRPWRLSFSEEDRLGAGDDMLAALYTFAHHLGEKLAPGLAVSRDNPGRTPPAWSIAEQDGTTIVTVGLIDRTYYWTWDLGTSNHYAKDWRMMSETVTMELARMGRLASEAESGQASRDRDRIQDYMGE